jgi:hypothetical protein
MKSILGVVLATAVAFIAPSCRPVADPPAEPGVDSAPERLTVAEECENIATLLRVADEDLGERRYERAESIARVVRRLVPRCRAAAEIEEDARRCRSNPRYEEFLALRRERFKSFPDEECAPRAVTGEDIAIHPDRTQWVELMEWADGIRIASPSLPDFPDAEWQRRRDMADLAEIQATLETCRIDLDFEKSTLYDIVDYIQEFAKINIVISAEVRRAGIPDTKIDFRVKDMVLKDALALLLRNYCLTSRLECRVLLVTSP